MDEDYTITEHDAATGVTVVRPMTAEERAQADIDRENASPL